MSARRALARVRGRARRARERGIALIMVLGALAILTVMLAEFQDDTTAEVAAAMADRDALRAEYLARSAVNLSRLLIAAEPTMRQAANPILGLLFGGKLPQLPVWEFSDRILGAFNDDAGSQSFASLTGTDLSKGKNLGLKGGRFRLMIVDEDSKLNVNLAARGDALSQGRLAHELMALMAGDQYSPLFEQRDRDDQFSDRLAICSALIDWADSDENAYSCDPKSSQTQSTTAAEDATYQLLKTPYRRKNAAYDSLDELHMVRGVGDDFWATFVDPEPSNPKKRVVTVWGKPDPTINVNTANAQTLWALVCSYAKPETLMCKDLAEAGKFISAVSLIRMFTEGAPIFGNPDAFIKTIQGKGMFGPLLTALGLKPVDLVSAAELTKLISTESKVFSIYADGIVPSYQRKTELRVHAVVDFRNAPPPVAAPLSPGQQGRPGGPVTGQLASPASSAPTSGQLGSVPGAGPESIAGALSPNPGGAIIYWRME